MPTSLPRPQTAARWLSLVAALVFFMSVVGGMARLLLNDFAAPLWQPAFARLPPLSGASWQQAFGAAAAADAGMTLADFKAVFLLEWGYAHLACLAALSFLLPLPWFLATRHLSKGTRGRLLAILAVALLLGAAEWQLLQRPGTSLDVGQYRVVFHLLATFFLLGMLVWVAQDLRRPRRARLTGFGLLTLLVLLLQFLLGAVVAGLKAGYASNSWPLMGGHFFPEGIRWQGFSTLLADPFLVHFLHRWWAWVTVAVLIVLARKLKKLQHRPEAVAIHSAFGTQLLLGIALVIGSMNFWLAISHQLVGTLVLITTVIGVHTLAEEQP